MDIRIVGVVVLLALALVLAWFLAQPTGLFVAREEPNKISENPSPQRWVRIGIVEIRNGTLSEFYADVPET